MCRRMGVESLVEWEQNDQQDGSRITGRMNRQQNDKECKNLPNVPDNHPHQGLVLIFDGNWSVTNTTAAWTASSRMAVEWE